MRKLSAGLAGLARELGIEESARLNLILEKWDSLAGERLAHSVRPWKLSEAVLTLRADSPLWLEQVNFFKKEILAKLEEWGVKDIRLTAGRLPASVSSAKKPKKRHSLISATIAREVEDCLVPIRDDELKSIARSALVKAINFEK